MVAPNAVLETEKHHGWGGGGELQCHMKTEYLPESPHWECVHRTETGTRVYTAYEQGRSLRSSPANVEMLRSPWRGGRINHCGRTLHCSPGCGGERDQARRGLVSLKPLLCRRGRLRMDDGPVERTPGQGGDRPRVQNEAR